jgi:cation transport ATPase
MADRIAGSFALVVLCLSLLTFVLWLTLLGFNLVPESWIPLEYRNSHVVLAFTLAVATMVRHKNPHHTPLHTTTGLIHCVCVVVLLVVR